MFEFQLNRSSVKLGFLPKERSHKETVSIRSPSKEGLPENGESYRKRNFIIDKHTVYRISY